jgi:hypothetical protein
MNTWDIVIRVATLVSVIVAIVTFWVNMSRAKKQMNAQVFIEYTKRFDQVISAFPSGAWCARTNNAAELPDTGPELRTASLRYLNLCAEELYLRNQGYLTDRVWQIWQSELERTLGSGLFAREWVDLRSQFDTYPEFRDYVDSATRKVSSKTPPSSTDGTNAALVPTAAT